MAGSQEVLDRFERQTAWPMMAFALAIIPVLVVPLLVDLAAGAADLPSELRRHLPAAFGVHRRSMRALEPTRRARRPVGANGHCKSETGLSRTKGRQKGPPASLAIPWAGSRLKLGPLNSRLMTTEAKAKPSCCCTASRAMRASGMKQPPG